MTKTHRGFKDAASRTKRSAGSQQRVVSRTDSDILDGLQNLPYRIDIIYKRGMPKADSVPSLRDQFNRFLDAEASAANVELCGVAAKPKETQ